MDVDGVYHNIYTPLITASYHGEDEIVKMLLAYGADVDKRVGEYHKNALYHAIWEQYLSTVKILVEAGADLESLSGIVQSTPPMHAARGDSVEIVKYLLDKGANPNATTKEGYTPLMYALLEPVMKKGNEEIISVLIEKSDLNHKTKTISNIGVPQTALLMAIMMNRTQVLIDKLFAYGAKIGESSKERVAFLKAYKIRSMNFYKKKALQAYVNTALKALSYVGYDSNKEVQYHLAITLSQLNEMYIIQGKKLTKKHQALFEKIASENIKAAAYHDMFGIIEDAKKSDQSEVLKSYKKSYKEYMPKWCFNDMKKWVEGLDEGAKKRVLTVIEVFDSEGC